MNFNTVLMLVGVCVFVLPVVCMIGYARHEKQHRGWVADSREGYLNERNALQAHYEKALARARNVIRELEISLLQAGEAIEAEHSALVEMKRRQKLADTYRKAIVNFLVVNDLWDFNEHSDDPMLMLEKIIKVERAEALDPAISKAAKNLHTRGVRKGAKAGREQMRKLMQKSSDNQAMTIKMLQSDLKKADEDFDAVLLRKNIMQQAYINTINDKMALTSVRKAFKVAVRNELGRLSEASKKSAL